MGGKNGLQAGLLIHQQFYRGGIGAAISGDDGGAPDGTTPWAMAAFDRIAPAATRRSTVRKWFLMLKREPLPFISREICGQYIYRPRR